MGHLPRRHRSFELEMTLNALLKLGLMASCQSFFFWGEKGRAFSAFIFRFQELLD